MAVEVPLAIVQWAQLASGIPQVQATLIGISYYESSWNPAAIGDGGCSFGLMQMYRCGGLGDPYTPEQLLDGPTNFRLAAQYIEARLAGGSGLWDALQPWTTRALAWPLIERIQAEGIAGVSGPTPIPVPGDSPVGRANLAAAGILIGGLLAVYWLLS